MRIVLACLALGVGAIAAVGSLQAAVERGMATQGRALLGGDLVIDSGAESLPDALHAWLVSRGARMSQIILLRTLIVAPSGARMLVELKSVDPAYPLVGAVGLDPRLPLAQGLRGGVVADPLVLQRLALKPGDLVRVGEASLRLNAALTEEPDHASGFSLLGPRVLIASAALPATKLIQPGSLLTHSWRVVLPPGADAAATERAIRAAFPDTGWRMRDASQAEQGVDEAVRQTSLFLVLVGLSALLVGGIGVATGVRAWLAGRARTIATLRCLGAPARLIFQLFLLQLLGLCGVGIGIGLLIGAALPILVILVFGPILPVPTAAGLYPSPLLLAGLYGLLTAGAFALRPLAQAASIPGAALFRGAIPPAGGPGRRMIAANAALGLALAGTIILTARDRRFALGFSIAALIALALFAACAWGLMGLARRIPIRRPIWLRLGITNLHRPAAPTPMLLVALGLGLTTLAAVTLIEGNIRAQFDTGLARNAPSFFFIDIQNDQLAQFETIVARSHATELHLVPSLRARIVSLNGVPAESAHVAPGAQWALRGDRGLTYAASLPAGSRVTSGSWWPAGYSGPPLLSLDESLARGWGLRPGDSLRANVLGRDIDFRIASLRAIDWRALGINFTMVASPGMLQQAPHMNIATLRDPPEQDAALLRAVTDALPNVTGIRVAEVLREISDLVGKLSAALQAAGAITLAAGMLVLASAVAAGQRRRMEEAIILKTLGATRAQIRAAWLVEFAAAGAAAGLLATLAGSIASWAVTRFVLGAPWSFLPGATAMTILGGLLVMLVFGYAGTGRALRAPAAELLRRR